MIASTSTDFSKFAVLKISTLIISSISLVAALAWNSAFQKYFNSKKELKQYGPWFYAIFITIIAIIIVFALAKVEHYVI